MFGTYTAVVAGSIPAPPTIPWFFRGITSFHKICHFELTQQFKRGI